MQLEGRSCRRVARQRAVKACGEGGSHRLRHTSTAVLRPAERAVGHAARPVVEPVHVERRLRTAEERRPTQVDGGVVGAIEPGGKVVRLYLLKVSSVGSVEDGGTGHVLQRDARPGEFGLEPGEDRDDVTIVDGAAATLARCSVVAAARRVGVGPHHNDRRERRRIKRQRTALVLEQSHRLICCLACQAAVRRRVAVRGREGLVHVRRVE
eukprot:scaffold43391_cov65-Phaeocystis_antarctica.AAC.6